MGTHVVIICWSRKRFRCEIFHPCFFPDFVHGIIYVMQWPRICLLIKVRRVSESRYNNTHHRWRQQSSSLRTDLNSCLEWKLFRWLSRLRVNYLNIDGDPCQVLWNIFEFNLKTSINFYKPAVPAQAVVAPMPWWDLPR